MAYIGEGDAESERQDRPRSWNGCSLVSDESYATLRSHSAALVRSNAYEPAGGTRWRPELPLFAQESSDSEVAYMFPRIARHY